jgi:outer membrane protein assembly factor BamB
MSGQTISAPAITAKPRRRLRFIFPAILLIVMVGTFLIYPIGSRLEVEPEALVNTMMMGNMAFMLCVFLMLVWFFGFSGFRWYTRIIGLIMLISIATVAVASVRKVEFTGEMKPIFVYRWHPDAAAEFNKYLSERTDHKDLPSINLSVDPIGDFPRYRGLNADGIVLLRKLDTDWKEKPPKILWEHPCGGGYSGFAVAGNVAITLEQRFQDEAVVCYDRATGRERWEYKYAALFSRSEPMGGDGPRATPTIDGGEVFSLGANGRLVCLDGTNGKEKWKADIFEDAGAKNIDWAMSGSPLVVGNLVILNPGINPADNVHKALAAYDRVTGKPVWQNGDQPAGYSSPYLATVAGMEQILLFDANGLAGFDPKTGKELWRYEWKTMMGMNIIQPVVLDGDRIFIASDPKGCALVKVSRQGDDFKVAELWQNRRLGMKFSNPIAVKDSIYGISYDHMICIDVNTGKARWKGEDAEYGGGQLLLVGDVFIVTEERKGEVALVAANPDKYEELARIPVLDGKTWNTPALAGNQLFYRNHKKMGCLELPLAGK